ncbi:uncharacterized protein METZ01_LOCUS492941, partial [marine metagenome]
MIRRLIPTLLIGFTLTGCEGHSPSSPDNPGNPDNPVDVDPGELTRSYPAVIRGLWEPGAWDQLATFVGNQSGVDRLKSLGINTVSVLASFDVLDNGEYRFQSGRLEMVKEEIVRYKRLGFAVLLSGNGYGVPKDTDPQDRLDNYLQSCRAASIELA